MIKQIVSDMDGTLLNSKKELSPEFENIYKQLCAKGIYFAVASGRPHYSLEPQFAHFKHDIIFIGDNGAYIGIKPEPIITGNFTTKEFENIIDTKRNTSHVHAVVCTPDKPYTESADTHFLKEAKKYYPTIEVLSDVSKINKKIIKLAIYDSLTLQKNSGRVWSRFNTKHVVAQSSDVWVDIMPKGVNKGAAVKYIQQNLGISKEQTMAFGDFHNDIEMLQMADYSYAMENGHDDVKKVAKFIAPANDSDGVLKVIEKMLLTH